MPAVDQSWAHLEAASQVAEVLEQHGFAAYFIGGAVRDLLLGRLPKDFDVVTDATPEQLLRLSEFERSKFKDTAQAFGVTRVVVPIEEQAVEVEIATFRRDIEAHLGRKLTKVEFSTLEDDVERRDFTINALAIDPATFQLIDYVGGLDDLEQGVVRFIGQPEQRLREDPLRILRGIRFRQQLGFQYHPSTETALREAIHDGRLHEIATDRIRDELTRMLIPSSRRAALEDLDRLGALDRLLPELEAMKGVSQPAVWHSEGDVWTHTLIAMERLAEHPSPRLAWATLLHDVGKPPTLALPNETGDRIRFNHHHRVGADMARAILKRLNFGKRFVNEVAWMIHYHLTVGDLLKMRPGHQHHFMSHPAFGDLIELYKADASATWNRRPDGSVDRGYVDAEEIEAAWQAFQADATVKPPSLKHDLGIDGHWVLKNFKVSRGQQLGKILDELNEAYLEGKLADEEDARRIVTEQLPHAT